MYIQVQCIHAFNFLTHYTLSLIQNGSENSEKEALQNCVYTYTANMCTVCNKYATTSQFFDLGVCREKEKEHSAAWLKERRRRRKKRALLKYAPPELPASSAVLVFTRNISSVHYTLLRPPAGQQTFPSLLAVANTALDHSRLADPKPQRRYATYLLFCFIAQLTSTVAFLLFPLITRVDTTDEAEHKIYAAKVLLVAAFSLLLAQGSHIMI